jgi:hypothetical protein
MAATRENYLKSSLPEPLADELSKSGSRYDLVFKWVPELIYRSSYFALFL